MFYLTKIILGTETGIHASPTDVYANNININCSNSINIPAGVTYLRTIQIKCTGAGTLINAKVYRS
jgi:hypothetical protein